MTRRMALSIFATVSAMLIIGGIVAFVATRSILLADLDASLAARAASLPAVSHPPGTPDADWSGFAAKDDRFVVRTEVGRTIARDGSTQREPLHPIAASFFRTSDGRPGRSVTIRTLARVPDEEAKGAFKLLPVTVTYSGLCERYVAVLRQLGIVLTACVLCGGLLAAFIARFVAARTLRPLQHTADVIGDIDEMRLDRRIGEERLPAELRPVARRLNGMLERLEAATTRRRRFLDDASHELRTPLAALATTLQVTLLRPRSNEDYVEAMQACLSEARHLRRLVAGIMEQARSEASQPEALPTRVDLAALLRDCGKLSGALGVHRGVTVRIQPAGANPELMIETEPDRLRSVAMNVLSNAVEYNRDGGLVELSWFTTGEKIEIRVSDNGPGIPAERLALIFEPFACARPNRRAGSEHLGLGLFITRAHVHALGGQFYIDCNPDGGTLIRIVLPLRRVDDQRASGEMKTIRPITKLDSTSRAAAVA